jgi:hypothetical protein
MRGIINGILISTIVFVVLSWISLLLLPFIVFHSLWLQHWLARLALVLSPLGTFGDLFGSINSLFSGLGLIAIAYAVILQQRELHEIENDRRLNLASQRLQARLNALDSLTHAYAVLYSTDPVRFIKEHDEECAKNEMGDPRADPGDTVISRLHSCIREIETLYDALGPDEKPTSGGALGRPIKVPAESQVKVP